ncbi:hypothetical protein B5S29_g2528 [[Candida] boidinii]|nr:hypothetical protein B5S29_g2528 [[Candida] boidinii]
MGKATRHDATLCSGGHGHGFIPSWIKPPTGGWMHTPKNHNVNGLIALGGYFGIMYLLYLQGEKNSYNPRTAYSYATIQKWNEAAKEEK